MAKKQKTLGLLLTGSDNWIGGLYYVSSIVKALQDNPSGVLDLKIVLFYNKNTPKDLLEQIKFKNVIQVDLYHLPFFVKFWFALLYRLKKRSYILNYQLKKFNVNVLYPILNYSKEMDIINCKKVYWIYDFQHKFLPHLFSSEELVNRDDSFSMIASKASNIVVSSYDAKTHFHTFFPNSKAKIHVLQFASIIDFNKITHKKLLFEQFNIQKEYFLVSNQFWIHKNHWVVLKALQKLKHLGHNCQIIFTGKEYDPRNPDYVKELKSFVVEHDLSDFVKFLGFISREDQLGLMKHCKAIIQPSKFEGWGTVVEDAKALGIPIILSDIGVHREQYPNGLFFNPESEEELADILINYTKVQVLNKTDNKISFAENIIKSIIHD